MLADESDGSVRAVARMPLVVQVEDRQSREETLAEALCWSLGVDGTFGWHGWPVSVVSGPASGRRSAPWCCTVRHRVRPGRLARPTCASTELFHYGGREAPDHQRPHYAVRTTAHNSEHHLPGGFVSLNLATSKPSVRA
jgi:hypothetical protein